MRFDFLYSVSYAILIAFPLQQWLRERAPVLSYTYFVSHFIMLFCISLPSWSDINTFYTLVGLEKVFAFGVGHCVQKSGHVWHRRYKCYANALHYYCIRKFSLLLMLYFRFIREWPCTVSLRKYMDKYWEQNPENFSNRGSRICGENWRNV